LGTRREESGNNDEYFTSLKQDDVTVKGERTVQVKSGRMSTICSLCAPMVRTEDNISALTESKAVLPLGFFFPASSLWMRKSLYKYAR
jgi:hypothetical protein